MKIGDLLRTDQVLLLENMTYLVDRQPFQSILSCEGMTVEDVVTSVDTGMIDDAYNYGSYMTGADWKNLLLAIGNDDILMRMEILLSHLDQEEGGGGGVSAVFLSRETGEVVVAFRGTAAMEWADDFVGGNMTETPQQMNALRWYQDAVKKLHLDEYYITVTGHSKGGNKAKFITILDPGVNRCVSFDGQGFSDVFYSKYHDEIVERQGKIMNHNVDYDYVNILLNDVGPKLYYFGYDYGKGGFAESHCPNTFFDFGENGEYKMRVNPAGQSRELQMVDHFLNSYIRSMPDAKQSDVLKVLGLLVEQGFYQSHKKKEAAGKNKPIPTESDQRKPGLAEPMQENTNQSSAEQDQPDEENTKRNQTSPESNQQDSEQMKNNRTGSEQMKPDQPVQQKKESFWQKKPMEMVRERIIRKSREKNLEAEKEITREEQDRFFDYVSDLITDPEYSDDIAYLLAYTIRYGQYFPDFLQSMYQVMMDFRMQAAAQYISLAIGILNYEHFDTIFGVVNLTTEKIPGFALKGLLNFLEKRFHFLLTEEQARGFFAIIPQAREFMKTIVVNEDGADLSL